MFEVSILMPNKLIGRFEVDRVSVPCHWGMLTIGTNHAPFVTEINPGILSFETNKKEDLRYFVSSGLAQVSENKLAILVDNIEAPTQIDKQRAQKAEERALLRLKNRDPGVDIPRALGALHRAKQRLMIIEQSQRQKH